MRLVFVRLKLLAITQLTSIDDEIHEQQHVDLSLIESVQNYTQLAESVGLAGVICSAHELPAIRQVTRPVHHPGHPAIAEGP